MKFTTFLWPLLMSLFLVGCKPDLSIGEPKYIVKKLEELGFVVQEQNAPDLVVKGENITNNSFFSAYRNQEEILVAIYQFTSYEAMEPYLDRITEPCWSRTYWGCCKSIQANSFVILFPIEVTPEKFDIIVDEFWKII